MKTIHYLLLLFLTQSTVAQSIDANYYPLKVGYEWTYKMPGTTEDNEQTVRITEYSDEYRAYLVRTIFRIGGALPVTSDDLIEPRKNRILRLGSRGGLFGSDWNFTSNLLMQFPLKAKSRWQQGDNGKTDYSVIGFVTLTVEAGTFNNVCKIKKVVKEFDMQGYLYYAPNIGLIKEEVINEDKSTSMFRELTSYKLD
jgi:hypothetical protein